jgi:hypothetical protein
MLLEHQVISLFGALGAGTCVGLRGSVGIRDSAGQTRPKAPELTLPVCAWWCAFVFFPGFFSALLLVILTLYGLLVCTLGRLFVPHIRALCVYNCPYENVNCILFLLPFSPFYTENGRSSISVMYAMGLKLGQMILHGNRKHLLVGQQSESRLTLKVGEFRRQWIM